MDEKQMLIVLNYIIGMRLTSIQQLMFYNIK